MKNVRRTIVACALASLISGCGDAQQRDDQTKKSVSQSYMINGKRLQLGETGTGGNVSLLASVRGDLNGDRHDDQAVILILNSGGSGVFYYLNVFLNDGKSKWHFAGEEFLGDRIKFDFLDIYAKGSVSAITGIAIPPADYGKLVTAFSVRSSRQSFAEEPRLYLSKHWKVEDRRLVPIEDY